MHFARLVGALRKRFPDLPSECVTCIMAEYAEQQHSPCALSRHGWYRSLFHDVSEDIRRRSIWLTRMWSVLVHKLAQTSSTVPSTPCPG